MLNIIDVGKRFGSMSVSSISYDNLTVKDKVYLLEQYGTNVRNLHDIDLTCHVRRELFDRHRMEMARDFGFDDKRMFVANQDKKDGSYEAGTSKYEKRGKKIISGGIITDTTQ